MFSPASPSSSFDFKPSPSRDFFPRDFPSPPSSASPQDYSFPARSKPPFDSAPSFVGSPYDPTTSRPPSSPSSFALQAPPEGTFGARSRFSPSFPMSGPSFSGLPAMDVPPNSPDRPAYPQSAYSLPATPVSPAYSSGSTFSGTSSSTSSGLKITKSRPTFSREQIREMENLLATAIYPSADEVAAASQRTGMVRCPCSDWRHRDLTANARHRLKRRAILSMLP
jgi:hypothetical protein